MNKNNNYNRFNKNINLLQSIGSDLKEGIDDLINQVETIKDVVGTLKEAKKDNQ